MKKAIPFLMLAAIAVAVVVSAAPPSARPPAMKSTTVMPAPGSIALLNPIRDVKTGGANPSTSWVNATLVNNGTAAIEYTTRFAGLKAGECAKYDTEYCKKHPPAAGQLCIDPCIQPGAPVPVNVNGSKVNVPAKGTAPIHIAVPNNAYVQGSKLEALAAGAAKPATANVPPFGPYIY